MYRQILLYGATGFSGRIVARAAARRWAGDAKSGFEPVLAGRDASKLNALGRELGLQTRVVALDDPQRLDQILGAQGMFAVINAAGPFAATAVPLAKAALRNERHYVDINGEADVYKQLDDYGYLAERRGITMVCGAGHSATTSDLMLAVALARLARQGITEVGTVRIAFSHVKFTSQGSAQTAWRSIREQTMVVRARTAEAGERPMLELDYEPSGRIERMFDFSARNGAHGPGQSAPPRRIAMLVNLLDLLTARITAMRSHVSVRRIESFIEMPEGARIFVQLGTLSAPLHALPAWRRLVRSQVALLPEGPNAEERRQDRHTVLLEIDDGAGRTLIDCRMETPDPYDFTADCVLGVTEGLARRKLPGWRTPAELFDVMAEDDPAMKRLFADCRFELRKDVTDASQHAAVA
ncbi:saccharopine dehydrogenase NADP-binding domain-containing protein [Variovorax sp. J22P168]|uniref:saccharopine dehydrogenase NADP-binding domain-containing protein n=1 Tax=Variovorax jilinensis TaxID=3053513 RepID=UPI002574D4AD|nr:saccharopine dehydrogenase NADP-binding domain-containing protein [Variovorax sp. J22P168]MDM0012455.1 saccharopine dehydrogenase NADP-binding domain-containing protein [Variovorax sp. J22P168]